MESLSLVPYADGRFEVFVDEDLVYSRLETGTFPDEASLVAEIAERSSS